MMRIEYRCDGCSVDLEEYEIQHVGDAELCWVCASRQRLSDPDRETSRDRA